MNQLTLLTKAYSTYQLKQVENFLRIVLEGLDVEVKVAGISTNRWVQIALAGEDEAIATNLMRKEIGFCPENLKDIEKFDMLKGYVVGLGKSSDILQVDIGIFHPEIIFAAVPLRHLQAVLSDGRKLALKKISELYGFCDGLPLNIKINSINEEINHLDATLSNIQLRRLTNWQESLLDRLIVLGASSHDVNRMLSYTGLNRDIIDIESLGMFEHALTCKLGTDAAGLISYVGRYLKNAKFIVFNPRKIREILNL
ncbi:MAG TPA: DUF2110 family protein [Candidatus Sulfotelmatobacter sp.]|nr:DUF2110 family protein [Candidatus Sulfotelmatobacter sp.]